MKEGFHVVFVCTGNRARSPLAEGLYREYSNGMDTSVTSYGTTNVGAAPPLRQAIEAAARFGIDLSAPSRAPLRQGVSEADLVLGFEPFHLALAIVDGRAPPANTFLLAELVSLLDRRQSAATQRRSARPSPSRTPGAYDPALTRRRSSSIPLGRPDEVMFQHGGANRRSWFDELVQGLFGRAG